VEIVEAAGPDDVDAAARIWAEATAARDGDDEVAGLDLARPLIEDVLASSPRSFLLLAREHDQPVGFAAVEPLRGGSADTAELRYLGVSPERWSHGTGRALLDALPDRLRPGGFRRATLLVYCDNRPAVKLYEGAGWIAADPPVAHPRTGKPEQRYELTLR
jgi:GNAT superfamily N-acetyltransferase